jgi:hypothetical protein
LTSLITIAQVDQQKFIEMILKRYFAKGFLLAGIAASIIRPVAKGDPATASGQLIRPGDAAVRQQFAECQNPGSRVMQHRHTVGNFVAVFGPTPWTWCSRNAVSDINIIPIDRVAARVAYVPKIGMIFLFAHVLCPRG